MKEISKVLLVLSFIFLLVGCGDMTNTPTKKVEQFLSKYQDLDDDVINNLDSVITDKETLTAEQKDSYRELMKKQYKNLNYKIKEETQDGNSAIVSAEIEVIDYGKSISESEKYLSENKDEFISDKDSSVVDMVKYMTYKIKQMTNAKDKITYTINFSLTKENGKWKLNDISDIDRLKLHGLYY